MSVALPRAHSIDCPNSGLRFGAVSKLRVMLSGLQVGPGFSPDSEVVRRMRTTPQTGYRSTLHRYQPLVSAYCYVSGLKPGPT
jgi:hypothetical protein